MPDDDCDEFCPAAFTVNGEPNGDHSHCQCWWDGDGCCRCKAPAMSDEAKRAQGMLED
jgi:hypothetical protein